MQNYNWVPGYEGYYRFSDNGKTIISVIRKGVPVERELTWTVNNAGYKSCKLFKDGKGVAYLLHRAVYEFHFGKIPEGCQIDHIDRNNQNNDIANLRLATHADNMHNRSTHSNNRSGIAGVSWNKRRSKWVAMVSVKGKNTYLGGFVNMKEAEQEVLKFKQLMFGEFSPQ